jgi:lysozyme
MRSSKVLLSIAVALTCLSGCTSNSGVDALQIRPSAEVTSSVTPTPSATTSRQQAASDELTVTSLLEMPAPTPALEVARREIAPSAPAGETPVAPPSVAVAAGAAIRPAAARFDAQVVRHRFRDAKPINFGKRKPSDHPVHGVDVSRWQGEIDWVRLRGQGANFAFIKATDGGDHLDPMFRKNWRAAAEAGLHRGAYHFFYWCRTGGEQADWFIRNVPRVEGALPPVIDVEYNGESRCKRRLSAQTIRDKMQVFMDKLEAHYGQRPIIYTAPDFYADNLQGAFKDYHFWVRAVAQHPSRVYPDRKWVFWQYSGSGLSHGVEGRIDLNVFHGSEAEWRRWVGGKSYVASN